MPKMLTESFAYTGQYSSSWKRRHGTSARDIPSDRFIVATQTHDQVGNRMLGERLSQLTDFDGLKLAAALMICSPYVPMLFMGEEYGETAPFLYFVSHGDPDLVEAVRNGRAAEFASFEWTSEPPDPQSENTFQQSKLDHNLRDTGQHAILHRFYRDLLAMRRDYSALSNPVRESTKVHAQADHRILCIERQDGQQALRIFMNFDLNHLRTLHIHDTETRRWRKIRDSKDPKWSLEGTAGQQAPDMLVTGQNITLSPKAFAIYELLGETNDS